jgi:hypothetical protein
MTGEVPGTDHAANLFHQSQSFIGLGHESRWLEINSQFAVYADSL